MTYVNAKLILTVNFVWLRLTTSIKRIRHVLLFPVSALNVQTQGSAAQLTKHKRFQRSFELSEGDDRLPKLFRQTVPQRLRSGDKTAVIQFQATAEDRTVPS